MCSHYCWALVCHHMFIFYPRIIMSLIVNMRPLRLKVASRSCVSKVLVFRCHVATAKSLKLG